ncbi:MAG: hypothetical protein ACRC2R_02410 [Xenococcaceae cyanobacterium]
MGEAKRRKKLDPNWGQPNFDDLLLNGKSLGIPKLKELADRYVPKEIIECAVEFSYSTDSYSIPTELLNRFSHRNRPIIELYWNEITEDWLSEFINELEDRLNADREQLKNALGNIEKGIALKVLELTYLAFDEEE